MSSSLSPSVLPRLRGYLSLLPLALILAGCVATPFTAPAPQVAADFAGAAPARSQNGAWWLSFRDAGLDNLIAQGLARNLSIQEAVAAIDAAEAGVVVTTAGMLPNAAVSGSDQRAGGQTGITETSSVTWSGGWTLDLFGGNRAGRAAAISELEAAKLGPDAARQTVAAAIAAAYVDLRYFQESIALTRQSIASRRETLELTRSKLEVGQANRLDELQAEQAVAQAQASLPSLEIGFDRSLNRLATLTASRSAALRPTLQKGASQPSARFKPSVGVPADVLRARPDVQIIEKQYAAAVQRIGVAEAAFWPSVSLTGRVTPTNIRGGGTPTSWAFGPQINLPLFTGGANRANLSTAQTRALQANLAWRGKVLSAVEEVENGLSAFNRGASNVAAQRRLVNTTNETVVLAREAWQAGQSDFLTVLDAERNLLSARTALASAARDHAAGFVALSLASGAAIN